MASRPIAFFPFWDRLPVCSLLRRVVGDPPKAPLPGYVPRTYVWESQFQMFARRLIDTLELPFDWPGIRDLVLTRAGEFYDIPDGPSEVWRNSVKWQRRGMAPLYWNAFTDLRRAVQAWLTEYDSWAESHEPSAETPLTVT